MNCQEVHEHLDDWVDGTLAEPIRLATERHLADCADCRRDEAELRDLLARAAALPRSIQPPHDLWPGILGGIERGKVVRGRFGVSPATRRWLLPAAAGLVLVLASSGLTALFLGGPTAPGARRAAATVAWQEFAAAESEYQRVTDELLGALEARSDELAPETVETVMTNLALIDGAIREAREALERDPANAGLANKLTDIYRKRVDFLQAMNRL